MRCVCKGRRRGRKGDGKRVHRRRFEKNARRCSARAYFVLMFSPACFLPSLSLSPALSVTLPLVESWRKHCCPRARGNSGYYARRGKMVGSERGEEKHLCSNSIHFRSQLNQTSSLPLEERRWKTSRDCWRQCLSRRPRPSDRRSRR
jgi:hypothetical protein